MILNKENMRNKKVILILCLLVLVSGSVQAQRLKAVQNENCLLYTSDAADE